jgi:hypothetical protein
MKTIFKYDITVGDLKIAMPTDSELLCVAMQAGQAQMWSLVDISKPTAYRKIKVVGTGWAIEVDADKYIGTYFEDGGTHVWHVFDMGWV